MLEIFTNSVMQSFVFSPLMGVIFGALFAGLSTKPLSPAPVTVIETRRIYTERYSYNARSNKNDGGEVFGIVFFIVFIVWKYLQFAPEVLYYIQTALIAMIAFGVTCFVVSAFRGCFMSNDWLIRIVIPTTVLLCCLEILFIAKQEVTPDIVEMAKNLGLIEFFINLSDYRRYYFIFHVIGLCCLLIVAITNTLNLLHYLALMNQREYSKLRGLWFFMTSVTEIFSGNGTYIATVLLLTLSFLLVDGHIALWIISNENS